MESIRGQKAILTGASRGIGRAIAESLLQEGVQLVVLGRNKPADLACEFFESDFFEVERLPQVVDMAIQRLGGVDILINNAGVFLEKPVPEIEISDWERTMRINLTAPFVITREVFKVMRKQRHGRIVNIVSTSGLQGYVYQSAYCASKHGLLGFARAVALEAKQYNVHVYNVCPGGVDTEFFKGTFLAERLKGQPLIKPSDVAETVVFLLKTAGNVDIPEVVIRRFTAG
jgi:NAD(P)-dependent dehydrogenase (short-subunit alcohol dehydrogenase family)